MILVNELKKRIISRKFRVINIIILMLSYFFLTKNLSPSYLQFSQGYLRESATVNIKNYA